MARKIEACNDFVVKFANVNGSGSASANELFARSILRMGVPVSTRNIFPSNIQGMPTWFEVRVTETGHLGRRGGCDMMVAMNPQSWTADVKEVDAGGYLFYDSSRPIPPSKLRDDINVIEMPITEIVNEAYSDARERQLFKNIVCIGALAALLDIDIEVIRKQYNELYKGKEKLLEANFKALQMGRDHAVAQLDCTGMGLKVRPSDKVGKRIFIDGNQAAALGCLWGGANVCAWYPITPSSSIPEMFEKYCRKFRIDAQTGKNNFAIIQAEDELASIGMVIGANWNGARAFTATSGPGISLMTEFLGLAYFAEVPATVINVQRGGPSTGLPSRTQQSDLFACAYASNGDTKHVLLFPQDPKESFDFAAQALDLADRLQTPVFLMLDLDIGMNNHLCDPFEWDDERRMDRGKVMSFEELEAGRDFGRYLDVDGDGIPYRTYPGTHPTRGAFFTRGTTKDAYARYSEEGEVYVANMQRLRKKIETAKELVPKPVMKKAVRKTCCGVIYFGSTTAAMHEAIAELEDQGMLVDALRVRAFPFHSSVVDFIEEHDHLFVVEQNCDAQLRHMLSMECEIDPTRLIPVLHYDGTPITARFITHVIASRLSLFSPLKEVAQ